MFHFPHVSPLRFAMLLLVALVFAVVVCACQSTPGRSNPTAALAEQIAIQYATGKFIEAKGSPVERAQRAAQVKSVVLALRTVAAGAEPATIGTLKALAQTRVAQSKLEASDRLLALALITAVAQQLQDRITDGVLTPEKVIVVNRVFDWVAGVAEAYGA